MGAGTVCEPLHVVLPEELWVLMGIASASVIGAPVVATAKQPSAANDTDGPSAVVKGHSECETRVRSAGRRRIAQPSGARWTDLFLGEEVHNSNPVDLARLQMLLVTAILGGIYALALTSAFVSSQPIHRFPALSTTMLALLAVSHSGYLLRTPRPSGSDR